MLLTNDDGYESEGIRVLKQLIRKFTNEVTILCPKKDQSGASHRISISNEIEVEKINSKYYIVAGSPVDCVLLGINKILLENKKPNFLFSGINLGANLGYDIYYSGTVAAALEGSLNGIKSIALSITKNEKKNTFEWSSIKKYGSIIIEKLLKMDWNPEYYLNINFPNIKSDNIRGIKFTKRGTSKPGSFIQTLDKENKIARYQIKTDRIANEIDKRENIDSFEVSNNYISICLLSVNDVSEDAYRKFKRDYDSL